MKSKSPKADAAQKCRQIAEDARNGIFKPVYLLMGEEPYYPELACRAIMDNCLQESEKDFNETVCYGLDVTVEQVISAARRFPMMAERQLVVVREAQNLKKIEELALYTDNPLESTVLVLVLHGSTLDKRLSLYKSIAKIGEVLDSPSIKEYEVANWIISHFASKGYRIEPYAAALLAEDAGTDLSMIVAEGEKLLGNLPEGAKSISIKDIEENIGISRDFSVFELTKALSSRDRARALRLARHIGSGAKFFLPVAVSALYMHFYRILKYEAFLQRNPRPSGAEAAEVLGVNPYFVREYENAVRNYPLAKTMGIISMLCDYDYLGKGGDGQAASAEELLVELTAKILNS